MDTKKYNRLDPSLHSISNYMSLNENKRKEVNKQLKEVLESRLLPAMKEVDVDFNNMFQKLHYSGSYYENLRIREANEFDLNLELRSQKGSQKFFQIIYNTYLPGFVQMQYSSGDTIKKWVNGNGCIMQNKVLCWLQGVVDKALGKISEGPWDRIWRKISGPAVTLYVQYNLGQVFSVDLVPVFVLDASRWPRPPVRQPIITNNSYAEQWCVVPKPNDHIDQNGNIGTFWRISFYNQEKVLLNNKNHMKNALKLMKLLRDEEHWDWLKSYFLKTVCLWRVIEIDDHYWNSGIGVIFMSMLRTLRDLLKDTKSIPFFWDRSLNLLSSVNAYEIQKIGYRLERIINDIDRHLENDPKYIETFFPTFRSRASHCIRSSSSSEDSFHTFSADVLHTETVPQESGVGWGTIALGIGALALGSVLVDAFLSNTENREQADHRNERDRRDQRQQRDQ